MGEDQLLAVPLGEVAEDDHRFLLGIDPFLLESGETFLADLVARRHSVVSLWFLPFNEVDLQLLPVHREID